MLTEFLENRRHVLQRNPNFRGEPYPCEGEAKDKAEGMLDDCGKMTPFVDRVVFNIEKEAIPLKTKFFQGYYDAPQIERLDVGTGFIVEMADSADKEAEYKAKGIRLPTTIEANTWYLGFNMLDPVVGDGDTPEQSARNRKLRQALAIAIDWEEHIAIFEKGQGVAAQGPLPPGLFGYREDGPAAFNPFVYRKVDGRLERRPLEDAKKLLAEAGYPEGRDEKSGRPLVLNFDYLNALTPAARSLMDWYQKQFAKIGVQLEIRATDYNRFQDKMNKGSHQIYLLGLARGLPGRRELPVPALRTECQVADQRQWRERVELPQRGVRQALRAHEVRGGRAGEGEADRRDDPHRAGGRRVELRLFPDLSGRLPPVGAQRQADADHPQPHPVPACRSAAARAEDRRVEPAGLVAGGADRARACRRRGAGIPRLPATGARERRTHAGARGAGRGGGVKQHRLILRASVIPAQAGIQRLSHEDAGSPLSRGRHNLRPAVIPAQAGIDSGSTAVGFPLARERHLKA